ncbi:hypothetical protein EIN_179090 [Entamoeba invadens IP1]|uniref:hypothetical protein n=1 Tax=Entamoeba invadens IP1 TaxID=370355 RepID=UPI0002C3F43B|nr:hypothetical protein EIN_179090 [Entamoeba invadens IP1]ELP93922.1 hypothetical protein EIN_179090 [Entamoeba invadens IP1]|eukprot:XP_004260693.1 hypothetical protein EIN_179090 [Entamoeba invadens IP1]
MFTSTAQTLGLLQLSSETNLLNTYDKEIQSGIVSLICKQFFSMETDIKQHCTSVNHISFVLEVIAAGFKMDLNFSDLIEQCIDLYEMWFVQRQHLPEIIENNFSEYLETILLHLTLVFNHAPSTPQQKAYETLCKRVIGIFQALYPTIRGTKTEGVFVRASVAVMEDAYNAQNYIVISETVRFFHVIWVAFQTSDTLLWYVLHSRYTKWIIHQSVATSWKETLLTVERGLISLLEGQDSCILTAATSNFEVSSTYQSTYLLWFFLKFLHLGGNLCDVEKADVHSSLLQAVGSFVDLLLPTTLNGNDILRFFCDVLYQTVIYKDHRIFYKSINTALVIFTKILITKYPVTTLSNEYMVKVERVLSKSLSSINIQIIYCVLECCNKLIKTLPTICTYLYSEILSAMNRITIEPKGTTSEIRPIAIELLTEIQFEMTSQRNGLNDGNSNTSLMSDLMDISFNLLTLDPENADGVFLVLSRLIVSMCVLNDGFVLVNKLLDHFLSLLSANYTDWFSKTKDPENTLLDFFEEVARHAKQFELKTVKAIFGLIQQFITYRMDSLDMLDPILTVFMSFFGVCYLSLSKQELLFVRDLMDKVANAVGGDVSRLSGFTFDIKLMNVLAQTYFSRNLLNTTIDEKIVMCELQKRNIVFKDQIRVFYVFENAIISLIQVPWVENTVTCIVRNRYGKNVYCFEYNDENHNWVMRDLVEQKVEYTERPKRKFNPTWATDVQFLNVFEIDKNATECFKEKYKQMGSGVLDLPTVITEKRWEEQDCNVLNTCFLQRMLSTVMNFNNLTQPPVEVLLPGEELFDKLRGLDHVSCIPNLDVSVQAQKVTQEYLEFVNRLGTIERVDDGEHTFNEQHYLNGGCQLTYHVDVLNNEDTKTQSALELSSSPKLNDKSELKKVTIVWGGSEDIVMENTPNFVIQIIPTTSELFLIRSSRKVGILIENQLCPFELLQNLIQSSLLSYTWKCETPRKLFEKRTRRLLEVASYLDTVYTSVTTHSLFSAEFIVKTIPVDFRNTSVIEVQRPKPQGLSNSASQKMFNGNSPLAPKDLSSKSPSSKSPYNHMRRNVEANARPNTLASPMERKFTTSPQKLVEELVLTPSSPVTTFTSGSINTGSTSPQNVNTNTRGAWGQVTSDGKKTQTRTPTSRKTFIDGSKRRSLIPRNIATLQNEVKKDDAKVEGEKTSTESKEEVTHVKKDPLQKRTLVQTQSQSTLHTSPPAAVQQMEVKAQDDQSKVALFKSPTHLQPPTSKLSLPTTGPNQIAPLPPTPQTQQQTQQPSLQRRAFFNKRATQHQSIDGK